MAERKKVIKMTISVKKPYERVNVRNAKGGIVGTIENGATVELLETFNEKSKRTKIKGKGSNGKVITGTVLTSCIK